MPEGTKRDRPLSVLNDTREDEIPDFAEGLDHDSGHAVGDDDPGRQDEHTAVRVGQAVDGVFDRESAVFLDELYFEAHYVNQVLGLPQILLIGALITPTVCHFIFDAWMGTRKHREAAIVYGFSGKGPPAG